MSGSFKFITRVDVTSNSKLEPAFESKDSQVVAMLFDLSVTCENGTLDSKNKSLDSIARFVAAVFEIEFGTWLLLRADDTTRICDSIAVLT